VEARRKEFVHDLKPNQAAAAAGEVRRRFEQRQIVGRADFIAKAEQLLLEINEVGVAPRQPAV
jgi:hypothetical protein